MDVRAAGNAISRRNAVVRIGAGAGLSLALATRSGAVFARQSTPSAEGELPPAMASLISALEATDPDRLAASYAPDGVLEEVGFGQTFTGQEAIRNNEAAFLAGFSNAAIDVTNAFAEGDQGAFEATFTGDYTGQLPGMPPGAGQPVTFRLGGILQIGSEGIIHNNQYFDAYGLLVQLGALPAPGGAATPMASPTA